MDVTESHKLIAALTVGFSAVETRLLPSVSGRGLLTEVEGGEERRAGG